ncbi:MAG: hypothetical protein Q8P67_19100 [archaeon]|nr:hypothetical protein [archaeon]
MPHSLAHMIPATQSKTRSVIAAAPQLPNNASLPDAGFKQLNELICKDS